MLKAQEENQKTEQDLRPTGKEIFMSMVGQGDLDDLTLDEEEVDQIVGESLELEEIFQQEGPLYDKSLFADELGGGEEEVDFD